MTDKPKSSRKSGKGDTPPKTPPSDAHLEGLGEALRQQYEKIKSEPVPERLKALIEHLRAIEDKEND